MSGHSRWDSLLQRKPEWTDGDRLYVKGYILAMEDVLKDIEELEEIGEMRTIVDAQALDLKIQESLISARRTLGVMLR